MFAGTPKGSAQDFLRKAFVSGAGQFGYRQHWLGEQDGQVVAAGTALSGEVNLRNMAVAAAQIIAFYGPRHCWQVLWRGLQLERIVLPPPKRTFYLAHLGVSSALTGHGIGSQLIDFLLQQGRASFSDDGAGCFRRQPARPAPVRTPGLCRAGRARLPPARHCRASLSATAALSRTRTQRP